MRYSDWLDVDLIEFRCELSWLSEAMAWKRIGVMHGGGGESDLFCDGN